jgi:hypothetical protein
MLTVAPLLGATKHPVQLEAGACQRPLLGDVDDVGAGLDPDHAVGVQFLGQQSLGNGPNAASTPVLAQADADVAGARTRGRSVPHGVRRQVADRHHGVAAGHLDQPSVDRHLTCLGGELAPVVVLAGRLGPRVIVGDTADRDATEPGKLLPSGHVEAGQKNSTAMPSGSRAVTAHP